MTKKELETKVINAQATVTTKKAIVAKHREQLAKMIANENDPDHQGDLRTPARGRHIRHPEGRQLVLGNVHRFGVYTDADLRNLCIEHCVDSGTLTAASGAGNHKVDLLFLQPQVVLHQLASL